MNYEKGSKYSYEAFPMVYEVRVQEILNRIFGTVHFGDVVEVWKLTLKSSQSIPVTKQ